MSTEKGIFSLPSDCWKTWFKLRAQSDTVLQSEQFSEGNRAFYDIAKG